MKPTTASDIGKDGMAGRGERNRFKAQNFWASRLNCIPTDLKDNGLVGVSFNDAETQTSVMVFFKSLK